MKRWLFLALLVLFALPALAGCGQEPLEPDASENDAPPPVLERAEHLRILLPAGTNKNVVAEHTAAFCWALRKELENQGWWVDTITVSVAESSGAAGKALDDGAADLVILPASQYFPYEEGAVLLMTATMPGLSVVSIDPADWNGSKGAPVYTAEDCPYRRTLICAAMSDRGKELAQASKNGVLTWEDVADARWLLPRISTSSDFIYPDLWLKSAFNKTTDNLTDVHTIDGYGALFTEAGGGNVDIIVIPADLRIDYSTAWQMDKNDIDYTGKMGLGHEDSIFNDIQVLGVTSTIYGDVMALSLADEVLAGDGFQTALVAAMDALEADDAARAIWGACGYTGFTATGQSYYANISGLPLYGVGD